METLVALVRRESSWLPPTLATALILVTASYATGLIGTKQGKYPPIIPYSIPWLGSAIALGKDPDGIFRQAKAQLGDIFGIQVAGKRQYHITSPAAITAVYRNAKSFVFTPTRLQFSELIFDMSHSAVYGGWLETEGFPLHHRHLAPLNLDPVVKALANFGIQFTKELGNSFGSKGEHTTMKKLIHQVTFNAISAAFFGPVFPAQQAYEPFLIFDDFFPLIAAGVPNIFLRKGIKSRSEIINMFVEYLENPAWEDGVCDLMKDMVEGGRHANPPMSTRDCAAMLLSDFWAAEGNMTWGLYWALTLPLHDPEGLEALYAEVDEAYDAFRTKNPDASIVDFLVNVPLPLIQSTITEALRFSSSSWSIRTVVEDGARVGEYEFQKGNTLICNTRVVHLEEQVYGEEAATFKRDRFLGDAPKKPWLPFGGGVSQCEGRHFAIKGCKVLVALFLLEFDLRLDEKTPSKVEFDMTRVGMGVLHPLKPTDVVVTPRQKI